MRDEILAGIKNAIEHGSSLDAAAQSFINAGYNPIEVKEALNYISGQENFTHSFSSQGNLISQPVQQTQPLPIVMTKKEQQEGKNVWLIVAIIFSLLIFLGSLGYLLYVLLIE